MNTTFLGQHRFLTPVVASPDKSTTAVEGALIREGQVGTSRFVEVELSGASIAMTSDGSDGGYGSATLVTLPSAFWSLKNVQAKFDRIERGSTGIDAAFQGDFSLGSTATADTTLATTEVNLLASTAFGAAASGGVISTATTVNDLKSSPVDDATGVINNIFMNAILDNGDCTADDNLKFWGTVFLQFDTFVSGAADFGDVYVAS